jgi:hypothetical protein
VAIASIEEDGMTEEVVATKFDSAAQLDEYLAYLDSHLEDDVEVMSGAEWLAVQRNIRPCPRECGGTIATSTNRCAKCSEPARGCEVLIHGRDLPAKCGKAAFYTVANTHYCLDHETQYHVAEVLSRRKRNGSL